MKPPIQSIVIEGLRATIKIPQGVDIHANSHLKNDIGIDSLTSMDFLMYLEDHIQGFYVDASSLTPAHFNTVQSMSNYVESRLDNHN